MHVGCGVCDVQSGNAGDAIEILLENGFSKSALISIKHLAELTPKEPAHNRNKDCVLCDLIEVDA